MASSLQGPLAAYLGVRQMNEASDMEKLGFLAKLQQIQEAQKLRTQMASEAAQSRKDIADAQIQGRADIAAQSRTLQQSLADQREAARVQSERQAVADREAMARLTAQLRPQPAPSMVVVEDKNSPTGWSHRNVRGGPMIPGAPPPAGVTKASSDGLSAEAAGKAAMADQAIGAIGTVRSKLFDKSGNLNTNMVMRMSVPFTAGLPFDSDARIADSAIRNAVEAKLRLETGAAATQDEINRTMARFRPTVNDTKESAAFKLNELEKYFKSTLSQIKGLRPLGGTGQSDPLGIR